VSAIGSGTLHYQWQWNGTNVAGATNASLTTTNAGNYTVVVSNAVGVVTSAPPAVLTLRTGPTITQQPTNYTVVLDGKAEFSVRASATGDTNKNDPLHYQWYFGGAALKGQTSSNLVFSAAQWTNNGSYDVVVSNGLGATTSAAAVLTVLDTTLPEVAITAPSANNFVTLTNPVTVAGTASDHVVGLSSVQVANATNGFGAAAGGTTNWTLLVPLAPGTNLITVQSVNQVGSNSATVSRKIVYQPSWLLTLRTNEPGAISSANKAVTNGARLIISSNYTVTASAVSGSGYLFSNWLSGTDLGALTNAAGTPAYTFVMETNLIVEANFVANPFPAVAGAYNGLFYPTNGTGVTEAGSGFIRVSVASNSTGAYSAYLLLEGGSNSFSGAFNIAGTAQTNLAVGAGKTPVRVTLNLDLNAADARLGGQVSNAAAGGWTSEILADRAVFNTNSNPATAYAGRFTLLLPPGAGAPTNSPDGWGYAVVSNSLGGNSTLYVSLADGTTPFTWLAPIASDGSVPLYQSLYSGKGSLLGWIQFTNSPPPGVSGNSWVNWIKTAATGKFYPLGFTNLMTNLPASPYTNATGRPALALTNGTLTLSNGNLGQPLIYEVSLTSSNTLDADPTNHLGIAINTNTGVVTVVFRPNATNTATNVATGVVLQNQTNAFGAFRGTNQSGSLIIK
jgi:hypothetical protein